MRQFVRVYEEFTDDSAYEHVNPNLILDCYIEQDGEVFNVVLVDMNENIRSYDFTNVKEAQRFINRVGGC